MDLTKCSECENEHQLEEDVKQCNECECQIPQDNNNQIKTNKDSNTPTIVLNILFCVILIISIFCFYKGYDVKNNYYSSEYSYSLNENAYVGGDAYNYIINGTYFTGYMVVGSGCLITSAIILGTNLILSSKKNENKSL